MSKLIILSLIIVASLFQVAETQEVIVTGFPLGVGSNVSDTIFDSYNTELQVIAFTLKTNPLAKAVVTGCADGTAFQYNHDSKNPGLAVGRAHSLRDYLIAKFNIDKNQIIVQSTAVKTKGDQYRYASVRIVSDLSEFQSRLISVEQSPPVENRITEIKEITTVVSENMGLQFGAGVTSSPFGGIPIVTTAIAWKKFIFIEGVFGHTLWDDSYLFDDTDLDTRRRASGGLAYIYPLQNIPVGIVGGWLRFEEISSLYNEYVKMSEGPVIGLRITPLEYLSINGVYNPAKHNIADNIISESKSGQFFISANFHIIFGGGK